MSDMLERICADKHDFIARCRAQRTLRDLEAALPVEPRRGFRRALQARVDNGCVGLIAEIKQASPSRGLIRFGFRPASLAVNYEAGGATCLSVLTDAPYFWGSIDHLVEARAATSLPVLRKDFILDPYQVVEALSAGADAILLILAALGDAQAAELESAALERGLDVLLEVHDEAELERALRLRSPLVGINNRNLKTLEVDLATTVRLAPSVPADRLLVCESGVTSSSDIARMERAGVRCFLVGESLLRQDDLVAATSALLSTAS